MNRYSLIQTTKYCYVCGTRQNIHTHEVFYGTANRKKSIEDGCCIYLCGKHHNLSNEGIHFNKKLDQSVKIKMEYKWLETYNKDINEFIKRYGKNYIKN